MQHLAARASKLVHGRLWRSGLAGIALLGVGQLLVAAARAPRRVASEVLLSLFRVGPFPLGALGLQDFLVEDRLISPVGDHLTGSLAEPKATTIADVPQRGV
jgi:hypothetical protein